MGNTSRVGIILLKHQNKTKVNVFFYKGLIPKHNKLNVDYITIKEGEDACHYDHKSLFKIEFPKGTYELFKLAKEVTK